MPERSRRFTAPLSAGMPRALVVDDVVEVARFVAAVVEEAGLVAAVATSYQEAIAVLDDSVTLVITDIAMPGRSGVELIAAIRARRPELPIVAMSGNGLALGEASHAGADALLLKPFELDELRTLVQLLALAPAAVEDARARAVLRGFTVARDHGGHNRPPSADNPVRRMAAMREIKRTLDGNIIEYPAEPLLVEPGVRAVLLCRIDEAEVVADGRVTLKPGTLSVGYFWRDRPYNIYHWLYEGKTLVHYINIGRFVSLSEDALVWDDYAVDLIAYPDGRVDVIDEDEIPDTVDDATRSFIQDATAALLGKLDSVVDAVNAETPTLLARHEHVVQR